MRADLKNPSSYLFLGTLTRNSVGVGGGLLGATVLLAVLEPCKEDSENKRIFAGFCDAFKASFICLCNPAPRHSQFYLVPCLSLGPAPAAEQEPRELETSRMRFLIVSLQWFCTRHCCADNRVCCLRAVHTSSLLL